MRFVADALRWYFEFHARSDGFYGAFIHDPLVVAAALDPDLCRSEAIAVDVDTAGGRSDGQTIADWRGLWGRRPNADVAVEADAAEFLRRLVQRVGISRRPVGRRRAGARASRSAAGARARRNGAQSREGAPGPGNRTRPTARTCNRSVGPRLRAVRPIQPGTGWQTMTPIGGARCAHPARRRRLGLKRPSHGARLDVRAPAGVRRPGDRDPAAVPRCPRHVVGDHRRLRHEHRVRGGARCRVPPRGHRACRGRPPAPRSEARGLSRPWPPRQCDRRRGRRHGGGPRRRGQSGARHDRHDGARQHGRRGRLPRTVPGPDRTPQHARQRRIRR